MTSARGLDASIALRLGDLDLDATIDVGRGEVVALLGPNGAGKTSLLRTIAGLHAVDRGRIVLDGDVLDDSATGEFTAPERRRLGVVLQDLALFEQMDLTENVAFGLRATGERRREARRPGVGLARGGRPGRPRHGTVRTRSRAANASGSPWRGHWPSNPRALLLDEPLAALDVSTRLDVRMDLRHHLEATGLPTLVVTHDPIDAHVLADRVVVLEDGRVSQQGRLTDLAAHPATSYVADLADVNLLEGVSTAPCSPRRPG